MGERVEEVENLKRASSLARDKLDLEPGKTLWGRLATSRTESTEAREGRGAETRSTARGEKALERRNPKRVLHAGAFNRGSEGVDVSGGARP